LFLKVKDNIGVASTGALAPSDQGVAPLKSMTSEVLSDPPLLSIITINRDNAAGLERTLTCLAQQSYKGYQQIVVDGGSVDNSAEVIANPQYKVDRWVSELDSGIYNAMNKAIRFATGRYLLFINSGDELVNASALEMAAKVVEDKDIYYFSMEIRPTEGNGLRFVKYYPEKLQFSFFFKDTLPHQSSLIKRDLFTRYGMYDENLRICSDWRQFMLCICRYNCSYQYDRRTLGVFFLDGLSSAADQQKNVMAERENVLSLEFPAFLDDARRIVAADKESRSLRSLRNSRAVRCLQRLGLLWKF
jgi:glycosyltransferase involved in cell wall biosynthesis